MKQETLANRFKALDSARSGKMERARECAALTIPSTLPPLGWNEEMDLPQPYSSQAAKGALALTSRFQFSVVPLNNLPAFSLGLKNGEEPSPELNTLLSLSSDQIYRKILSNNFREIVSETLLQAIIVGDYLIEYDKDMLCKGHRLDHFVVLYSADGILMEAIYMEFEKIPNEEQDFTKLNYDTVNCERRGYRTIYCQYLYDPEEKTYKVTKQYADGTEISSEDGIKVPKITHVRWNIVPGTNYGRSYVESLRADIKALEGFTEALLNGLTAASVFWMCIDPGGRTDIAALQEAAIGAWVSGRKEDIFVASPAATMQPQISSAYQSVETYRQQIAQAFLMAGASIPNKDRVTAEHVRVITQELHNVVGIAAISLPKDLWGSAIRYAVAAMIENGELDPQFEKQFFDSENATLSMNIMTGLQALNRETELQKLMQMGEMVRNLPPQAQERFKWEQYNKSLITAIGFNPENWVKSDKEVAQERQLMMQEQAKMMAMQGMQQAALQDVQQTGGQNVSAVADELIQDNQEMV